MLAMLMLFSTVASIVQATETPTAPPVIEQARKFEVEGNFLRARDLYEAALEANPKDSMVVQGMSASSERLALQELSAGQRDQALADLIRAQHALPDDKRVLYDLGILEDQMSLYQDSAVTLEYLETLTPVSPESYYALARVHLDLGRLAEATREMQLYLQAHPEDASAHFGMGKIALQSLHYEDAKKELERSVELQPKQVEAYYELGEANLQQGSYAEAIDQFKKAIERDPRHGGALTGLGTAHFKLKQYDDAEEWLKKAVAAAPEYQAGHYYLGLTLARRGDESGSKVELARAAELAERANHDGATRLRLQVPETSH